MPQPRLVLMGDSITFHWPAEALPDPAQLDIVNRGIPRQTSSDMASRFATDALALAPAAIAILAGTNDLKLRPDDTGQDLPARLARNLTAMSDAARAHGITLILGAVPPIGTDHERLARDPATILAANRWIRRFAASCGHGFADYHAALADQAGNLPAHIARDGLHPNAAGYRLMWPALRAALVAAALLPESDG